MLFADPTVLTSEILIITAGTIAFGLSMAIPMYALSWLNGTLGMSPRDVPVRAQTSTPEPELQRAA
jgi:hypothetical protein